MGLAGQSRWQQGVLRARWPQLMALTVLSRLCNPGSGSTLLSLQREQSWLLPPPADG